MSEIALLERVFNYVVNLPVPVLALLALIIVGGYVIYQNGLKAQ